MHWTSNISTMGAFLQLMETCVIILSQLYMNTVSAATKLEMTAPLNPVEENGVFSVHCKVFELDEGYEVSIYRQLKGQQQQRLSIDTGIVPNFPDERFFLANRQMDDGTNVYFLSVMQTTQKDAGKYICKLFEPGGSPVEEDSVDMSVLYFPEDDNPQCSPSTGPVSVPCGQTLTLNCTAIGGKPEVSLQWFRVGSDTPLTYEQKQNGDTVYSELHFTPRSMQEDKSLFICKMTSDAFPGKLKTCHVERIKVVWTPEHPCGVPMITSKPHTTKHVQVQSKNPTDLATDCLNTCPYRTAAGSYWILGTVAAALIALIFFIIVLFLVIKLHHQKTKSHYIPPPSSDLYAEVENRRLDNRIYMALEKRDSGMRCFDGGHDYVGTNNRRL